jgi:hypothetical protein
LHLPCACLEIDLPKLQLARHPQMHIFDFEGSRETQHHNASQKLARCLALDAAQDDDFIVKSFDNQLGPCVTAGIGRAYRISKSVALVLPVTPPKGLKVGMV